jgi:hypothetical protein
MATKVLLKKSSVAARVPTTSDLEYGELALNYTDGKLYYKDSTNVIRSFTTSSGTVQISGGGTGATTRADAINNLLPNQSVAAGLYLTSDGTNVSWSEIGGGVGNISDTNVYYDTFTGNGADTIFEISVAPPDENAVFVSINGVLQDPSTYSVAGTSLTFSTAPDSGDNIDARTVNVISTTLSLRDFQKYIYTIVGTTDTVTGADDNGLTLEYDAGKVDVYQNGVRLLEGSDYTAIDGDTIDFIADLASGDVIEVLSYSAAYFLNNPIIANTEALTTTDLDQVVDTFAKASYRTAKYLVQAIDGSDVHCTEVLITHNDNDVFVTEYGTMYSAEDPLITVSASIDSNYVYLTVTPLNPNTTVDFTRTSIIARTIVPGSIFTLQGDLQSLTGSLDLTDGLGTADLNA